MFSLPVKVVAIAIVVFAVFQTGYCLQCYLGDDHKTNEGICPYACMKVTEDSDGASIYVCSLSKHEDDCSPGKYLGVKSEICYCNTDLCNSSSVSTVALPLLLGALLMKMVN
ncbi:uncharacterized protein [Palaemon carinicauda]|uniref:uncharacterized protein isoform X3 n=1 Tax=Palaemon carinicauda TaxID=392227 RepID=UPI0035B69D57